MAMVCNLALSGPSPTRPGVSGDEISSMASIPLRPLCFRSKALLKASGSLSTLVSSKFSSTIFPPSSEWDVSLVSDDGKKLVSLGVPVSNGVSGDEIGSMCRGMMGIEGTCVPEEAEFVAVCFFFPSVLHTNFDMT